MSEITTVIDNTISNLKKLEDVKKPKVELKKDIKGVISDLRKSLKDFEEEDVKKEQNHFENGLKSLYWGVSDLISKSQKEILSRFEKKVNVNTKVNELLTDRVKSLKSKIRERNANQTMDKSHINSVISKINESFDGIEKSV